MTIQDLEKEISDARNANHALSEKYDRIKEKRKYEAWTDEDENNLREIYVSLVESGQYLKGLKRGLEYVLELTK